MNTIVTYLIAAVLVFYGMRSVIAGINNEKRSYWMSLGYSGLKDLFKEKHDKFFNLIYGSISASAGIVIILVLLKR